MIDSDKKLLLEAWKHTVSVQMHFNDLELRIRNYAFVLTGAFLALGGYAIRDGGFIQICGIQFSVASILILVAVFPVLAFRMMDLQWYHPLLMGSVLEGAELEKLLVKNGVTVSLGSKISQESSIPSWIFGEPRQLNESDISENRYPKGAVVFEKDGKKYARKWGRTWRSFRSKHKMIMFYRMLILTLLLASVSLSIPLWLEPKVEKPSSEPKIELRLG